jgi:hypothetical protein
MIIQLYHNFSTTISRHHPKILIVAILQITRTRAWASASQGCNSTDAAHNNGVYG